MALGIYKPGQGYWVRVLTATIVGVIMLAAAGWLYSQMGVVAEKLPKNIWSMKLVQPTAVPQPGQKVILLGKADNTPTAPEIGDAVVESYNASANDLRVRSLLIKPGFEASGATGVAAAPGPDGKAAFTAAVSVKSAHGIPSIEPMFLQAGVAALVLVLGALLAYYLAAMNARFIEFLISVDMEMKKVNWSTRKDIISSTWVVIGAAFLISTSLFLVDLAFQAFFSSVGILVK